MASVPLDIVADVEGADPADPDGISRVRGQDAVRDHSRPGPVHFAAAGRSAGLFRPR